MEWIDSFLCRRRRRYKKRLKHRRGNNQILLSKNDLAMKPRATLPFKKGR